jgi:hypothetical protein
MRRFPCAGAEGFPLSISSAVMRPFSFIKVIMPRSQIS